MIQTQISFSQETLLHPSSSFAPHLPDNESSEYSNENEGYDEEYEEDNSASQDLYSGEEETEDFPTVWYHLPTQKPDLKQEKFKAEKLKERNQQIQQKKEQSKDHTPRPLNFLKTSEKDHVSFKKISKLQRPSPQARLVLEIAEKNLLVILFQDEKTIKVYNTLNFNLVTVTKAQKEVKCMSYCKKLGRIIAGGVCEFLQLWSPKTFEVEAECLQIRSYQTIFSVSYVAKSNVIVTKAADQIRLYNTGLRFIICLSIPSSVLSADMGDIFGLSKHLLLVACHSWTQKGPILFNLKTKSHVDYSKTAFIPKTTCIEMTEKTPVNVFSCLGMFISVPFGVGNDNYLFPLIQFTIDTKNEELVPLRRSNVSTHTFSKLKSIQNSKYFLAEKFERSVCETYLLSIEKDKIEILRVISKPSAIILNKVNTYLMLKDGLSLIEVNDQKFISVYRSVVHREKPKKKLEETSS